MNYYFDNECFVGAFRAVVCSWQYDGVVAGSNPRKCEFSTIAQNVVRNTLSLGQVGCEKKLKSKKSPVTGWSRAVSKKSWSQKVARDQVVTGCPKKKTKSTLDKKPQVAKMQKSHLNTNETWKKKKILQNPAKKLKLEWLSGNTGVS